MSDSKRLHRIEERLSRIEQHVLDTQTFIDILCIHIDSQIEVIAIQSSGVNNLRKKVNDICGEIRKSIKKINKNIN